MGAALTTRRAMGVVLIALALSYSPSLSARRASITLVTAAYSPAPVNDNTITLSGVQSGDVVMVVAGLNNTTAGQTVEPSDNLTTTWTGCPTGQSNHASATTIGLIGRYAVSTGNMTTVTLTSSSTGQTFGGAVVYRGMGSVTCDGSDTDTNDVGTSLGDDISLAPSTTNDTVLFGGVGCGLTCTFTGTPAGYTEVGTTLTKFYAAYKVVNATSANSFATTLAGARDSVTSLMAIKSSVAATANCGRFSLLGVGC